MGSIFSDGDKALIENKLMITADSASWVFTFSDFSDNAKAGIRYVCRMVDMPKETDKVVIRFSSNNGEPSIYMKVCKIHEGSLVLLDTIAEANEIIGTDDVLREIAIKAMSKIKMKSLNLAFDNSPKYEPKHKVIEQISSNSWFPPRPARDAF